MGKIKNAKKHTYKDIVFDSGLELFCYKELEKTGIDFIYQPEPFILLPKFECNFTNYEVKGRIYRDSNKKIIKNTKAFIECPLATVRQIAYTTDFMAVDRSWIIETKGYSNESFPLRWKMFKYLLNYTGFNGKLLKPENQNQVLDCIKIIMDD